MEARRELSDELVNSLKQAINCVNYLVDYPRSCGELSHPTLGCFPCAMNCLAHNSSHLASSTCYLLLYIKMVSNEPSISCYCLSATAPSRSHLICFQPRQCSEAVVAQLSCCTPAALFFFRLHNPVSSHDKHSLEPVLRCLPSRLTAPVMHKRPEPPSSSTQGA